MHVFTPGAAILGGVLIGLAGALLLAANGRIAGISGILSGVLGRASGGRAWRVAFLAGLLFGGFALSAFAPAALDGVSIRSPGVTLVAGLLVGVGTQLGGGCTSGHGVCGIGRGSPRSIVATITFIATGMVVVTVVRTLGWAS